METAYTVTTNDEPEPEVENVSTHVTLSDTHLKTISDLMQASFQPQMVQIVQQSFKSQVSDLVSSIVPNVVFLEKANADLKNRVPSLGTALDNAQQYSQRNCLKISGVPETTELSTDDYVCNLAPAIEVDLTIDDIYRNHRLGKPHTGALQRAKPRDIIVEFISYLKRISFYKARILTKSRGFQGSFIIGRLTKVRANLLYEASRRVKGKQLKRAWSSYGTMMFKLNDADPKSNFDGTVLRVSAERDLPA